MSGGGGWAASLLDGGSGGEACTIAVAMPGCHGGGPSRCAVWCGNACVYVWRSLQGRGVEAPATPALPYTAPRRAEVRPPVLALRVATDARAKQKQWSVTAPAAAPAMAPGAEATGRSSQSGQGPASSAAASVPVTVGIRAAVDSCRAEIAAARRRPLAEEVPVDGSENVSDGSGGQAEGGAPSVAAALAASTALQEAEPVTVAHLVEGLAAIEDCARRARGLGFGVSSKVSVSWRYSSHGGPCAR